MRLSEKLASDVKTPLAVVVARMDCSNVPIGTLGKVVEVILEKGKYVIEWDHNKIRETFSRFGGLALDLDVVEGDMADEKRTYILYDSRAADGMGTDDASVLVVCEDEKEAASYCGDFGGMACYSYADDGKNITDERFEWNWFPGQKKIKVNYPRP